MEWITGRVPTESDSSADLRWFVWTCYEGRIRQWSYASITLGEPWQPIVPPEPYVKPKRWRLVYHEDAFDGGYYTIVSSGTHARYRLPVLYRREHREAAERIAAIYEEVMS